MSEVGVIEASAGNEILYFYIEFIYLVKAITFYCSFVILLLITAVPVLF